MKSKTYLLLLKQPSTSSRRELVKYLKEHNVLIIAQYDKEAIEVIADENQSKFIQSLRMFIVLDGPMVSEHRQKLTKEQYVIIDLWNTRFSPNYKKLKKDYSNRGESWTAKGFSPPAPYSAIDAEQFREKLKEFERKTRKKPFLKKI